MTRYEYRRRLTFILIFMFLIGWGMAVEAVTAVTSSSDYEAADMTALPWVQMFVGGSIAAWGGATATLGRYLAARYDNSRFIWQIEAIKDLFVSLIVGAGGYLLGVWTHRSEVEIGLILMLSGYLGTRVLTVAADRLLAVLANKQPE